MRILSYNICRGGRGKEALLCETIAGARPDIVVLQEATDPEVVERLAAGTGMAQWAAKRGQSLGFLSREKVRQYECIGAHSRQAFLKRAGQGGGLFGLISAVYAPGGAAR